MESIGIEIFEQDYDPEVEDKVEEQLVKDLREEGFSLQEEKFINEYFIDFNEKEAVVRSGYSVWNANRIAKRLMESPKIQKEIERRREVLRKRYEISPNRVLEQYSKMANSNIDDFFENGKPLSIDKIPRHVMASLNMVETYSRLEPDPDGGFEEDGVTPKQKEVFYLKKFKQYDKKAANDSLSKHLGLFGDNDKVILEFGLQKLLDTFPPEMKEAIKLQIMKRVEGKLLK